MNRRKEAIELASAHLRDQGSALVVHQNGLRRNKRLGLWHVDYYDPEHPDELLCGGGLAVWDDGRVESVGSAPSERDMIDAEVRFTQSLVDALSLPDDWHELLGGECYKPYWETLQIFLRDERRQHTVYPPEEQVFSAFHLTRYADTRVVILGQDPYHQPGQADGLCFSVPEGITRLPALINIHKELHSDLGIGRPEHGNLESWARQGVLLLNTTLTVQSDEPNAHHGEGWETFTDEVIKAVNEKSNRVVFILWGAAARSKKKLIDTTRHRVVEAAHPTSRPNAHNPFLGSRPFSKANRFLEEAGVSPIDWATVAALTDEPEEIVVYMTENRALVFGTPAGTERSRWGRWIADLTRSEWASLLRTLDPATRAFIESQRWTGGLVELDDISRAMWSTAKKVAEEGGWIQANLRNERGQFARLMRVRPATGVAAMAGGAAILGAIAAQAQTAEIARDVKAIRRRVDEISKHLQSDQIGAAENAVEQVEGLVLRLRADGTDGVEASEFPVIRNSLGDTKRKCMRHLRDAVTKLENADQESPRHTEKILSDETAEEVLVYLDLLGKIHLATVQLELAQIALYYHAGKFDVVKTWTASITQSAGQFRAEIEDVCGRLGQLDEGIRALFRPAWDHAIRPAPASGVAGAGTAYAAARKLAGTKTIRVPGVPIPIPVAAAAALGGALLALGGGGAVNAVVQPLAQKKLDKRLGQLTGASSRSSQTMDQATLSLEVLRTLTEELAGPGE